MIQIHTRVHAQSHIKRLINYPNFRGSTYMPYVAGNLYSSRCSMKIGYPAIGMPIIKIRRPLVCLVFIEEMSITVRQHFHIEMSPYSRNSTLFTTLKLSVDGQFTAWTV